MTITSEAPHPYGHQHRSRLMNNSLAKGSLATAMPLVLSFEANWRLRTVVLRGLGLAMMVSASGLWLFPSSSADPELNLMKVGVSVLFFVLGFVLTTLRDLRNQPEACFDPVRRELRVLRRDAHGHPKTVLRRSYDTIGGARLSDGAVQLFENDGSLLIEVPLGSTAARSQLRDQLSGAVQLYS
ncbi:hypothetical protein [Phaeobacter sp. 11ANDIMAR09]|uniref:hypothetical protein n=1 Tax=Phaeobacter sp. 11ANDIMAR09 TaxID=1225647 RepID=UPI000AD40FDE|nr:hypothetical protein [Phaeobacter sp. 11ANDIMAR09]